MITTNLIFDPFLEQWQAVQSMAFNESRGRLQEGRHCSNVDSITVGFWLRLRFPSPLLDNFYPHPINLTSLSISFFLFNPFSLSLSRRYQRPLSLHMRPRQAHLPLARNGEKKEERERRRQRRVKGYKATEGKSTSSASFLL